MGEHEQMPGNREELSISEKLKESSGAEVNWGNDIRGARVGSKGRNFTMK